jgi:DNA-binding MarR family transcriptional regulator
MCLEKPTRAKGTMAKKRDGQGEAIGRVLDDLRRVFQIVHGYSKRAERVGGLTGPQLWAVKVVSESSPVRVSDLARRMYLHPSTVVGIVDRLEVSGLVVRTRSTRDRRVVTVSLSDRGKRLVANTPAVAQGLLLTGLKGLQEAELRTVMEGLSLLVGILGADDIPPRLLFSDEVNAPGPEPFRRPAGKAKRSRR